jgi:hypothetical protein
MVEVFSDLHAASLILFTIYLQGFECYYCKILKLHKYGVLRSVTIKKKVDGNKAI